MPTLSGITIAAQAVLAQAQVMQVIEHNVANANTPGYRRQAAILSATVPSLINGSEYVKGGPGQVGTGVTVQRIERFNLHFFDARFRGISAEAKNWEAQSEILAQFESVMSETSDDGMLPKLDAFWASWQSLSNDPTSNSLRSILLDNAGSLANAFTRRSAQITQMRLDQDLVISDKVDQINSLASEVASLNAEISRIASVGEQPNDLMDKRDLALDRLSELAGAVSFDQKNGETTVSIAGHVLVVGHETIKLKTVTRPVDLSDPTSLAVQDVYWDDNRQLLPPSGELKGVLQVRDEFLRDQQIGLNTLASNLITEVNALHVSGYGLNNAHGLNFFTGTDANTIAVNSTLDPASIGASSGADQPGNIAIATQIAGLKFDKLMAGTITMNEFYNQQITERSLTIKSAVDNAYNQNVVVKSLGQQRESVAGVSLDEEAANMARTQKAYQAAARLLTAYDEMLDTVINRMGLVGR